MKAKFMYEKMYHTLLNAITDAIELLETEETQEALARLEQASRDAEELYISQ